MAEKFNNYLVSVPFSSSNRTVVIVPSALTNSSSLPIQGQSVNHANGSRTSGSTSQIHSIYLTKSDQNSYSANPENDGVNLSIGIYDTVNNKEYFLARYVKVLPNSSFYIEKTITLRPQDCIRLTYHGSTAVGIDSVCSGVDLT